MGFIKKEKFTKYEKILCSTLENNLPNKIKAYLKINNEENLFRNVNYKINQNNEGYWFIKKEKPGFYCQYIFGLLKNEDLNSNNEKNPLIPNLIINLHETRNKSTLTFYKEKNNLKCYIRLKKYSDDIKNELLKHGIKIKNYKITLNNNQTINYYLNLGQINSNLIIENINSLLNNFNFKLDSDIFLKINLKEDEIKNNDLIKNNVLSEINKIKNENKCIICKKIKEPHQFYNNEDEKICIDCIDKIDAVKNLKEILTIINPEENFNQDLFLKKNPEKEEQLNILKEQNLIKLDFETNECHMVNEDIINEFLNKYDTDNYQFNKNNIETKTQKDNIKYKLIDQEGNIKEIKTHKILKFKAYELYIIKNLINKNMPTSKIAKYMDTSYNSINDYKPKIIQGKFDKIIEEYGKNHDYKIYKNKLDQIDTKQFDSIDKYEIIDKEGHIKKNRAALSLTIYDLYQIKKLKEENIPLTQISKQFNVTVASIRRYLNQIYAGEFDELFNDESIDFNKINKESVKPIKNNKTNNVNSNLDNFTQNKIKTNKLKFNFIELNNNYKLTIYGIILNKNISKKLKIIENIEAGLDLIIEQIIVINLDSNLSKINMEFFIKKEDKNYVKKILTKQNVKEETR